MTVNLFTNVENAKMMRKSRCMLGFSINHHHHKWNSLMKISEGELNEGRSSHVYLCASCFTSCQWDPCHRLLTSLTWFMNPKDLHKCLGLICCDHNLMESY
jgi:hypothetical protein